MIHVLINLPKEYDVILNGLENQLMATADDALTIDLICKKLNHRYEKIKSKKEEKTEKEKAMGAYNKQYKQPCQKCGKYSHKPGDRRCPENKKEKNKNNEKTERMATTLAIGNVLKIKKTMKIMRKQKDMNIKIKKSKECANIAVRRGI